MKKILFVTTVESTMRAFLLPYMKWFAEQGYEVHAACAAEGEEPLPYCRQKFALAFSRSPLDPANHKGYKQLKKIISEGDYALVHCHTPVAGVYARLAARGARKRGVKVVYTVHGFHFYQGAARKNWLIFYPVEKWLARYTDCLITINDEDYQAARSKGFRAGRIAKVSGVGVDLDEFQPVSAARRQELRREKQVPEDGFLLFYAAELSPRKNQLALLPIVAGLKVAIPNLQVLLAGKGPLKEELERAISEQGLSDYFQFLGFRHDVKELVQLSDLLISTSRQEGLPVNIMEGMASGKPVVASRVRGNRDLIQDGINGFLFDLDDTKRAIHSVKELYQNPEVSQEMAIRSRELVQNYALSKTLAEHGEIYRALLES